MKVINLILLGLFCSHGIVAQNTEKKYSFSFNLSSQSHDLRSVIDNRLSNHWTNDMLGVHSTYLILNKKISQSLTIGVGGGIEYSTTYSGLRASLVGKETEKIKDIPINRYIKYLGVIPFEYKRKLTNNLDVGLQLICSFGVYRKFKNTRLVSGNTNFSKSGLFYNDLEFNPFLSKSWSRLTICFMIRAFHLKRVDDAIFFKDFHEKWKTRVETDVYEKNVDIYNPLKISLSFNYKIK
jgi:hypothetical protein